MLYGAFDPELGAVGGGSHNPRVTSPRSSAWVCCRPNGGAASPGTSPGANSATDAAAAGVRTVFMSAGSDDVARIYEGVGFRRVGTACIIG